MKETAIETTDAKAQLYVAYHVTESEKGKYRSNIGVAWIHKDGKGFNADIHCMPLDGKIVFRLASEKKN